MASQEAATESHSRHTLADDILSSPRSNRKRTNDEIYTSKPDIISSPRRKSAAKHRPSTAPEPSSSPDRSAKASLFERQGFPRETTYHPSIQAFASTGSTLQSISNTSPTALNTNSSFVAGVQAIQATVDQQYGEFNSKLQQRSRQEMKGHLEELDWNKLEAQYSNDMNQAIQEEHDVMASLTTRYKHMLLWLQISSDRESERSVKRLRTRMAVVQYSEDKLRDKTSHKMKVLHAFHNAMTLLGGS